MLNSDSPVLLALDDTGLFVSTLLSVDPNGWDATLLGGATREVLTSGKRMKEWKAKGLRCLAGRSGSPWVCVYVFGAWVC